MGDNKKWFKVWTAINTDPHFLSLELEDIGRWLLLGAMTAQHGVNGCLTIPKKSLSLILKCVNGDCEQIIRRLPNIEYKCETDVVSLSFLKWSKYQTDWNTYERLKKWRKRQNETVRETVRDKEEEEKKKRIRRDKNIHIRPTFEEVKAYCQERGKGIDAQRWFDYYSANGWKVGKNPMKDWKAAVRTWEKGKGGWD